MQIEIPEFTLIALIGASSSGKTTFARKHFLHTQVLSSDAFRGMVCDDENDQSVSGDAFALLYHAVEKRLEHRRTTVIDATNLQRKDRKKIVELAKAQNVHASAIVLNLPESVLLERNRNRKDRMLPESVMKSQNSALRRSIRGLKKEGFRFVYVLDSEEEINHAEIVYTKLWSNKKEENGPFDIIGDVHGCLYELTALLDELDYVSDPEGVYRHPDGRKAVFVGDLCDRGPDNVGVLRLVMGMVRSGTAFCVPGNHENKLERYLNHRNVQITHGLERTVHELEQEEDTFQKEVHHFLENLVSHYIFDDGRLVVSHAGIREEYIGRVSARIRAFCLYGDTSGEIDEAGLPIRKNWAADYRGSAMVVYGHTPQEEVRELNRTYCVDTGCVFGGKLSCMRYPEKEIISVSAHRQYYEPGRSLKDTSKEEELLNIEDIKGKMHLTTKLLPSITISEEHTAAALEMMSRFAADPHWLIYLPPTMSPCKTSPMDEYLEHPAEAFAYYQKNGIEKVVCEKKHMGSRAVIILCRTSDTAQKRFGVTDGSRGIIYTRTGRKFFENPEMEKAILDRLDRVLTENNFWTDFHTDWVCLDSEIMPWSEKAQALLKSQYGTVGKAGRKGLSAALAAINSARRYSDESAEMELQNKAQVKGTGQTVDLYSLQQRFEEKQDAVNRYVNAYRQYCWSVHDPDELRIAPFHLLACEGKVFSSETHVWHMENLKKYCTVCDPIFIETEYITVNLSDQEEMERAAAWWTALTEKGGEGMVIKPETFTAFLKSRLIQPAVKCRGREYLRIIYGPEYLMPEHMARLNQRSLSRKRSLAQKEFSLGMKALERFVAKEPLYRVHECVFAVLALESEPVDPAL